MDKNSLKHLLENVKKGKVDIDDALETLRKLPYEDLGFARVDHHRALRVGFPEVIFCQGKTIDQIVQISDRLTKNHKSIMATRASKEVYDALKSFRKDIKYHESARIVLMGDPVEITSPGKVLVITAGTSDIPVADEAAVTAEFMGNHVERLFDVGVAGIHRLFDSVQLLQEASVIVVAAGMEGALPSIIGGLVNCPVIAVPTSVGYGASFGGLSALLTMLNSCAPGILVVNIDNGFGAGYSSSMINNKNSGEKG